MLEPARYQSEARRAFERAVELAPDSDFFRAEFGLFLLRTNQLAGAEKAAALLKPFSDNTRALLLQGGIAVRRGRAKEAEELALWVLSRDSVDPTALALLVQAKAARSLWLGLWWRYNVFFSTKPVWLRMLVMVPICVPLMLVLGPMAYLLIGYPVIAGLIFIHVLRRELRAAKENVRLKKGF